jgi:mRNA-degrading endonuclease toxin of MazEF toxin-antitoxin module
MLKPSAFNAQGSRVIICSLRRSNEKYVAAVEAFRKKERQGETQFDGILSVTPTRPPPDPPP